MTIMLCCFALSACGPVSSLWNDNEPPHQSQQSQPVQLFPDAAGTEENTQQMLAPMLSPPDAQIKPLLPGQSGTSYRSDGLPALQPSRGVKLEELFAQDLRDPERRMARVENAVLDIRRDLDAVTPSIVRLVAVEKDIQYLVEQLEVLLRHEPPPAPTMASNNHQAVYTPPPPSMPEKMVRNAPQSLTSTRAAEPPVVYYPTPATISGQFDVKDIRFGEHKNKTRIVMDVTGKPSYRNDLDNTENLLVIEIPNAGWTGKQEATIKKSPLVASYSVRPMNGSGSRLIIQLKKGAKVIYQGDYTPNKDSRYHRLVIDIAGL